MNVLAHAFSFIGSSMSSIGLQVSVEKFELWSPNPDLDTSLLPPEITVQRLGLKNLGAPVSDNQEFISGCFPSVSRSAQNSWSLYACLKTLQSELHLRSCAALPKIIFSLRTCDPSSVSSPLSDFDSAVHNALEAITGSAVSENQHLLFAASFEGSLSRQLCRHQYPR